MGRTNVSAMVPVGVLVGVLGLCRCDSDDRSLAGTTVVRPPTVVMVVLDTVRSDFASPCGAGAQQTPTLTGLVSDGAVLSCDAVAPGSWTLPSHASFFTGLPIEVHGAHFVPLDTNNLLGAMQVRPLNDAPTIAEHMKSQGYRTMALSGNPVVSESTGLMRGFEWSRSAANFGLLYGDDFVGALDVALEAEESNNQPLFVFLNIADAHQPWSAVPEGVVGLTPQPAMGPRMAEVFQGRIEREALQVHFEQVRQAYAYGVRRADDTLGRALATLEARGWAETGMRVVVVSDHGEFLGEHGLVDHGRYLWEENQRIFLLQGWRGPNPEPVEELPIGLSARYAYHLTKDGRLPDVVEPTTSVAYPDTFWQKLSGGRLGGSFSAAVWEEHEKLMWQDGNTTMFDLREGESHAVEIADDHPLLPTLNSLVTRAQSSAGAPTVYDPELLEQLKAAGYMED